MRKTSFEWVLTTSDGEESILTENQYEFYKENWKDGPMFFRDTMINPSFVIHAYKRPAEGLFKIYPCMKCSTNGYLPVKIGEDPFKSKECPVCKGTGLDFNYVQKTE